MNAALVTSLTDIIMLIISNVHTAENDHICVVFCVKTQLKSFIGDLLFSTKKLDFCENQPLYL